LPDAEVILETKQDFNQRIRDMQQGCLIVLVCPDVLQNNLDNPNNVLHSHLVWTGTT
jgi:hypothetical protein